MRIGTSILIEKPAITIRKLVREDVEPLRRILETTQVFSVEEVGVAIELMDVFLNNPHQQDYDLYSASDDGRVVGYVCVGPTPLTAATYDLYWIAVDPSVHHKGVGSSLMRFTEESVYARGGRLIVAETSSQPKYDNTRRFYIRQNFQEVARIKGYYNIDDDLVIYGKYLSQ